MHINEGLLQAYLDKEVSNIQKEIIESHLQQCPMCLEKLNELRQLDEFINTNLTYYKNEIEETPLNSNFAYQRFKQRMKNQKWKGLISKMMNYRKIAAGLAATIIFATTVFVPPVRQAAADFLHIFRVQQIETVQLNIDDLNKMRDEFMNKVGEVDLKQLGKAEIISQAKNQMMSLSEAAKVLPFAVKYPANYDFNKEAQVNSEFAINFTLNVAEVNGVLKQLGANKFLPEELNNKKFSVYSPGQIGINIEEGGIIAAENVQLVVDGKEMSSDQVKLRNGSKNWVYFSQIGSPEFTVPNGVDISELREILLNIPIIPNELKNNLRKIQDWQHTLLVPTEGDNEIVYINGEKAILEQSDHGNTLFWIKNGVIYNLSGSKEINLVEIAKSLRDVK